MSYAQRTTVGQPATFNEIERTLKRYGATAFMYGAAELKGAEGWVAKFSDGSRWKFKG